MKQATWDEMRLANDKESKCVSNLHNLQFKFDCSR